MTLTKLIEDKSGMKLPRFARHAGIPLSTLRGYALPLNSKASRQPSRGAVWVLAKELKVSTSLIIRLTRRKI